MYKLGMSIDMKFHIDTGGDHIETKLLVSLENVYLL
jgi:hypothetical protein